MDDLRRQGQQGLLGAQMTSVVVEATNPNGKKTFKRYRLPTEEELSAANIEMKNWKMPFPIFLLEYPMNHCRPLGH